MTILSKVGNPHAYEDGDQRHSPRDHEVPSRLLELGSDKSYADLEPKDPRPLAEILESIRVHEHINADNEKTITDPLAPARSHGNQPSRGAQIDAELKAQDEEILKNKGKA